MKILITGGCGFLGGHLVERLRSLGHDIVVLDRLDLKPHPTGKKPKWFPEDVPVHVHTLGLAEFDQRILDGVEVVVHLAAQVSVADSVSNPNLYIVQNTLGTALLLTQLERCPTIRRIVLASSMSVYGEGGLSVKESAPCVPQSPYGLTKYDQERLCLIWGQAHLIPVVALRFFNVYGPRQALDNGYTGVLANFAKRLLADQPPIIYEDGGQSRDFVYVEDVARACEVASTLHTGLHGAFNICTGQPTTILQAAKLLARAVDKSHIEPTITNKSRLGDIRHCTGSTTRAAALLGFTSRWDIQAGLRAYGEWLRA